VQQAEKEGGTKSGKADIALRKEKQKQKKKKKMVLKVGELLVKGDLVNFGEAGVGPGDNLDEGVLGDVNIGD